MLKDDHYIANRENAHIGTSDFEEKLRAKISDLQGGSDEEIYECVYNQVFRRTNVAPPKPGDNDLLCRYLTPIKFLRFVDSRRLNFPLATQFADPWECSIPEDYNDAIVGILETLNLSISGWTTYVRTRASEWNVSCWTRLENYFDDHLMWSAYAGGIDGVGITVRYRDLRALLEQAARELDMAGQLQSGLVNYETLSLLPFNKHRMFRNENEVRFAFRNFQPGATSISVDKIFDSFGVRISPAAPVQHRDMIRKLWLGYGGQDRIQWPR